MSVESLAIALHHSRAKGTAKLVLIGIANHDGDGGAWPAVRTLALYAGVQDRSVQNALRELERLHEVRVDRQQGGDASTPDFLRPNRYVFLLTCPPDCDRTKNHRTRRRARLHLDPVHEDAPGALELSTGVHEAAPDPVHEAAPKPSLEPVEKKGPNQPQTARARETREVCAETGGPHEISRRYGLCVYCGQRSAA